MGARAGAIAALLLICHVAMAQKHVRPTLPETGRSIEDFVPKGWHLLSSARGDLNGDALSDAALVIEADVPDISRNGPWARDTSHARTLVIVFKAGSSEGYRLATRHDTFILRENAQRYVTDPLHEIRIARGLLEIDFRGGAVRTFSATYRFRYRKKEFALVGVWENRSHQMKGLTITYDFDFTSRVLTRTTLHWTEEPPDTVTAEVWRRKLPKRSRKTLGALEAPFTWEVFKGMFL